MASSVKNKGGKPFKLARGKANNLGTITATNDVVQFVISEPTRDHQGVLCIMCVGSTVTGVLNASLDGGTTWFAVPLPTVITSAAFGDTASSAAFYPITVSGLGGECLFAFGRTDATGTATTVFALVG